MAQTIWLARHGNRYDFVYPEWFNTAPRRYDPPLSKDGMIQAEQLAKRLESQEIEHIFSSPFLRTIQTAYPIAEKLNLPIKLESGLGEWHNSDWMTETPETHSRGELELLYPLIDWNYTPQIFPQYPETISDVRQRIKKTIAIILEQFTENIIIIGHSLSVQVIANYLVGDEHHIKAFLCSLTKIIKDKEETTLVINGDTSHLTSHLREN